MADTFKTGDVVTLTSGRNHSPVMVVKEVDGVNCICIWFNTTTHLFEEYKFPNETISKV